MIMDLIFFGMQGSGKGTLGKAVAEKYGLEIFETGAELRKLAQEDSELGRKIKKIIDAGELVSDEVIMEIVENFINNLEAGKAALFDGIPRKIEQAKLLNTLLKKHDRKFAGVLLEISEETALRRLTTRRICKNCKEVYPANYENDKCKCGGELITRSDDVPESIKKRIETFKEKTVPAMTLYKDHFLTIDGEPQIEEVQKSALKALDTMLQA